MEEQFKNMKLTDDKSTETMEIDNTCAAETSSNCSSESYRDDELEWTSVEGSGIDGMEDLAIDSDCEDEKDDQKNENVKENSETQ